VPASDDLASAVSELDDEYLKVMLLLALNRARSEEPRRAGFWHALAVTLADEQESRGQAAALGKATRASKGTDASDLQAVLDELRNQVASLESELRESSGDIDVAGAEGRR
jgi:hypothetical protein